MDTCRGQRLTACLAPPRTKYCALPVVLQTANVAHRPPSGEFVQLTVAIHRAFFGNQFTKLYSTYTPKKGFYEKVYIYFVADCGLSGSTFLVAIQLLEALLPSVHCRR